MIYFRFFDMQQYYAVSDVPEKEGRNSIDSSRRIGSTYPFSVPVCPLSDLYILLLHISIYQSAFRTCPYVLTQSRML